MVMRRFQAKSTRTQPATWFVLRGLLAIGSLACGPVSSRAEDPGPWTNMMDGGMDQWEGPEKWFRIQDEAIVAGSLEEPIPHNQFLCSKQRYTDFEMVVDVKLVGEGRNAGVQFRSERVPESSEVRGYQADAGRAWQRPVWGALYDESRRRKMLVDPDPEKIAKTLRPDDYNELRIRCVGSKIEIFLNGVQTVSYLETESDIPDRGVIGLQIHSGPASEAWYRNPRIRTLSDSDDADVSNDG